MIRPLSPLPPSGKNQGAGPATPRRHTPEVSTPATTPGTAQTRPEHTRRNPGDGTNPT